MHSSVSSSPLLRFGVISDIQYGEYCGLPAPVNRLSCTPSPNNHRHAYRRTPVPARLNSMETVHGRQLAC